MTLLYELEKEIENSLIKHTVYERNMKDALDKVKRVAWNLTMLGRSEKTALDVKRVIARLVMDLESVRAEADQYQTRMEMMQLGFYSKFRQLNDRIAELEGQEVKQIV